MKVTLKGNILHIEVAANTSDPKLSSTGKTFLIASESEKTDLLVKGQPVRIALNAFIKVAA